MYIQYNTKYIKYHFSAQDQFKKLLIFQTFLLSGAKVKIRDNAIAKITSIRRKYKFILIFYYLYP